MNKSKKRLFIVAVPVSLVILAGFALFIFQKQYSSPLSAEAIDKKFECSRMTMEVRETDIFCGNPKFYNDPSSITKEEFYEYYACAERLGGEPPAESAKTGDPGYYEAYYNCKEEDKLESLRQDLIDSLEKLRKEH